MKKTRVHHHLLFFLFFFLLLSHPAHAEQKAVKIGVLAMRGVEKAVKNWGPTAEYLTQSIPGHSFSIVPLAFEEVYVAVREKEIDFLLTNTGMFVDLEYNHGITPLATLKNQRQGKSYTVFGGVIFRRADREDIKSIEDLKGKKLAAVDKTSFGGWQMSWMELKKAGIEPGRDLAGLAFKGTHDAVVHAVRDGQADAGSVRTDTLERMEEEGNIRSGDFYVLPYARADGLENKAFPFPHSTHLYPEWPFSRLKHTPDGLAEKVSISLLNMPPDHPAALAAHIAGWTVALDYRPVHDVMRELKAGPYNAFGEIVIADILRQYVYWIIVVFAALTILIAFTFRVSRLNKKIEQELRTRTLAEEELREAKEQAEEATRLKDKFVSLVAHDLKAPLFAITGFLSIILNDGNDPLHKDHREMVEQAHEAGTRLLKMIEGLLNINRLQTGKLVPQKRFFDGRWAAAAVIESLKQLAREKGIELANKVPRGTRLYADMDLFRQVLQNLVSNSIKFCGKGDIITLYVPHGENATIAVIDTGVGISDRTLPDIFKHEEPTSTLGTAGERGTGLGLPLSHDIMKAHGGTLSAASIKGEGTVFYAQLPYVRPEILIAGADEELRLLLKEDVEINAMNIIDAKDGEEALKFLDGQIPHLILVDLEMSRTNGLDLLERISENTRAKEIPVIVITGDSNMEARQKAFQLGAGDFAVKPLVSADLIPRIRRFVG